MFFWQSREFLIHSFKTALATVIGFLLTKLINFPADQWIIVTILVVMCAQLYVGSVIKKSYLRFLGTFLGSAIAAGALIFFGNSVWVIAATIAFSSFLFSYLSVSQTHLSYAGTLGAVTTAIILLSDSPSLNIAVQRFIEISIGIFIAAIVSQCILPIHARVHLRRAQAHTLSLLREHFAACFNTSLNTHFEERDEAIIRTISKQRELVKEAAHEYLGLPHDPQKIMAILSLEKNMLRTIDFIYQAKIMTPFDVEATKTLNLAILNCLDALILQLKEQKNLKPFTPSLTLNDNNQPLLFLFTIFLRDLNTLINLLA